MSKPHIVSLRRLRSRMTQSPWGTRLLVSALVSALVFALTPCCDVLGAPVAPETHAASDHDPANHDHDGGHAPGGDPCATWLDRGDALAGKTDNLVSFDGKVAFGAPPLPVLPAATARARRASRAPADPAARRALSASRAPDFVATSAPRSWCLFAFFRYCRRRVFRRRNPQVPVTDRRLTMKRNIVIRRVPLLAMAVAATLIATTPLRAQTDDKTGYAWGMMGPGMMMGGYGRGGMMGPGMMDMMMGGGMMGGGGMGMLGMLDLSDDQRAKIRRIEDEQRKKNRDFYGKIEDESVKLRDLYDTDTPDAKKIGAAYDKIFDLKRQAIVASIEAQNKARAVLTKEQQDQLKNMRRGRMPMGPRGGTMGPGMMGR